ncbi:MAG: cbb3-type cytochrome c oxidase subunit I [Lentisphaerae bacterium]|nr:cbb3-type cytochrome c oxidase subunit I [Lentisphaerota bacterium]
MISSRLKMWFLISLLGSIGIALIGYFYTATEVPPYPGKVVSEAGTVLTGKDRIMAGQQIWQKYGLMDVGSVWGHGTYRGPDFTAQALHLTVLAMRAQISENGHGASYSALDPDTRGAVDAAIIRQIKANRYVPDQDTLTLSPPQEAALTEIRRFYDVLFEQGDSAGPIRAATIRDPEERRDVADFFFWTAWCSGTLRPGDTHTYTSNWPHDPEAGNVVSGKALVWSAVSLVIFGACLGLLIFLFHHYKFNQGSLPFKPEPALALASGKISSSQRKTAKFFLVVAVLFLLQVSVGGLMAHYVVHPSSFFGWKALADFIPYAWVKTWHLQLAVFWIAVSWIGFTLFVAPRVGNKEPKAQGFLVDLLFAAVLVVALGSLTGEVLGLKGLLGKAWFWLGHQGWEYLELGRLWQILLLAGLVIWLALVVRGLKSHFTAGQDRWGLPHFLAYSGIAVVGFFCCGLFYDSHSHLTIADFWRWWVVHTWVEGAFEFFASAAIVFVLVNLHLVDIKAGMRTVYFTVSLALFSGIIGVGHHYYWFGTPSFWLALGSTTSTLEPVPILLLLADVWHGQKALISGGSSFPYRYPLMFIMASVCWELLGAGVMGLSITTPVMNYFEHGTYLTVNHGHTALFGTYGLLAIALLLFSLRGLVREDGWSNGLIRITFWGTNIGLFLMFLLTLLPVGMLQVLDNVKYGFWHARSDAFWQQPVIQNLGMIRLVPDTLIGIGAVTLTLFMLKAITRLKPVEVQEGEAFTK